MKPAKKKPAKRKPSFEENNPVLSKLLDLKYRLNEAYRGKGIDTKTDKSWVMKTIEDVRGGVVISADKMRVCNNLWKRYETKSV